MSINALVTQSVLEKKIKIVNQGLIFINFVNLQNSELFELRIFFIKYNMFFTRLNTKSLNRLFLKSFQKNVVLSINNKNFYLSCSNLFLVNFNNIYSYFFFIFIFLTKYKDKIQFLFFKLNNNFLFFDKLFFLLNDYCKICLVKDDLLLTDFKNMLTFFIQKLLLHLKIKFVNFLFVLKILIFVFFYKKIQKEILI